MRIHNDHPVSALHGLFYRLDRAEQALRSDRSGAPRGPVEAGARRGAAGAVPLDSARVRELGELRAVIGSLPDVREALVLRLRAEIASEFYHADSRRIAQAMLDEERDLLEHAAARRS
jgi:anti-sigma28 factor (negative regulator of flagellin synthesis)